MRFLQVTDSDTIGAVGFDPQSRDKNGLVGVLGVVFKSSPDTVYFYENVSAEILAQLVGHESIGKEFHRVFRATKYPFTKSQLKPTLTKGGK